MSDTFNGYHVWLGIPANEQPPNHYRLLGIAVFETDLDVIDHASDRQMAHVRTFQSGRHQALSQQILNELANARLCLLNAARKAEYDEQLRGKLDSLPKAAAVRDGQAAASGSSGGAHHASASAAAVPAWARARRPRQDRHETRHGQASLGQSCRCQSRRGQFGCWRKGFERFDAGFQQERRRDGWPTN